MGLSQIMDNLAPARLFLRQTFLYVPDIKTPPTPELFLFVFIYYVPTADISVFCSSSSTTLKTSSNVVSPRTTSINPA